MGEIRNQHIPLRFQGGVARLWRAGVVSKIPRSHLIDGRARSARSFSSLRLHFEYLHHKLPNQQMLRERDESSVYPAAVIPYAILTRFPDGE